MTHLKWLLAIVFSLFAMVAHATQVDGQGTYDLLFKDGTLNDISRDHKMVYDRQVTNKIKPDAGDRDTGDIVLDIRSEGSAEIVFLEFLKDGKHRGLGKFPASVGNPMIMYFYETTVRDMTENAGGSPFYIRNRIKESLIEPSDVVEGETEWEGKTISTRTITLRPFDEDPNRMRMREFGDLELIVTMSDDVPGWYVSLGARAGEAYVSEMRFDRLEDK